MRFMNLKAGRKQKVFTFIGLIIVVSSFMLIIYKQPSFETDMRSALHKPVGVRTTTPTKKIFPNKFMHLDLKGAPPSMAYLTSLIPILKKLRIKGILMEYEDTFPYRDNLTALRNKNFYYSESDIKKFISLLKDENIQVVPLVQTFGHLEFLLKHSAFEDIREIKKYPQVVCPSNPKSRVIIEQLIDQIVALHPGIQYIHIGSDEVYHLGKCQKCRDVMSKNNWNDGDLFLSHVTHVVNYCVNRHKLKPMVWDDHFRGLSDSQLEKINIKDKIELVVWEYRNNVLKHIGWNVMTKYSRHFPHIWAASAFKGAQEPNTYFHSLKQRILNHISWHSILQNNDIDMEGIIMTGWQRYDHLAVLCEILPMGIPSLVINALFLDSGKLNRAVIHETHIILDCDYDVIIQDTLEIDFNNLPICRFPGAKVFKDIVRLRKCQKKYTDFTKDPFYLGWLQHAHQRWGFSSPFRIEPVLKLAKKERESIVAVSQDLNSSLSEYFDSATTEEFIYSYVTPIQTEYERIVDLGTKCLKLFDS